MNNALIASFWESGWFGRAILIILFSFSIYAWAIIAMKWRMIKEINRSSDKFLTLFQRTKGDIPPHQSRQSRDWCEGILSLYQKDMAQTNSPFQVLYQTVCDELAMLLNISRSKYVTNLQLNTLNELADRTISNQLLSLEKYLIVLATTASVSPLLGLLGTVWGVLISFRGMSALGSASLAVVAPGISEALVTTVTGLIVAIPAMIGYNWITNRLQVLSRELENFSSRLLSYIQAAYTPPLQEGAGQATSSTYEKEPAF